MNTGYFIDGGYAEYARAFGRYVAKVPAKVDLFEAAPLTCAGVTTYKGKRKTPLLFIGQESNYGVPAGFVYPMLGAFRALLETKGGRYVWGKGLDPVNLLKGTLGEKLAETIGNFALDARNPSKTGKQPLVWQSCYQAGQVVYLKAKTA